jgi:hypothetical protein
MIMFDLIGDIHGHADRPKSLLLTMDYQQKNGSYSHPERKALFIGDYIDRGPQIPETLRVVRSMVENGDAIALMGNHEYNAICFHYQESAGGHLRPHLIKNVLQHYETLRQFQNRQSEYDDYIEWFMTLPLFHEDANLRAVHAAWDHDHINFLSSTLVNDRLNEELVRQSVKKDTLLYEAIEDTLKGKEVHVPGGWMFQDKDGNERNHIRTRWWENPKTSTYKSISVIDFDDLPETAIENISTGYYTENEKPVFFGHYWLKGQPKLFRNNVCCLDYSVAKGGLLVAYRFDGEKELKNEHFMF